MRSEKPDSVYQKLSRTHCTTKTTQNAHNLHYNLLQPKALTPFQKCTYMFRVRSNDNLLAVEEISAFINIFMASISNTSKVLLIAFSSASGNSRYVCIHSLDQLQKSRIAQFCRFSFPCYPDYGHSQISTGTLLDTRVR